jgi:ABC-type cobalamin/Fe3+-siderophores transport system ATPase subunit
MGGSLVIGAVDLAGNGLAEERPSHSCGADSAVFDVASVVVPSQIQLVEGLNGDGKTTLISGPARHLRRAKGRAFILACDLSHGTSTCGAGLVTLSMRRLATRSAR